jgi:hypothetical protein
MSKLTLTIEGSPTVLAQILAALPDSVTGKIPDSVTVDPIMPELAAVPNAPSIPTGTPTPVVPAMPSAPTMPAPTMPAFSPPAASDDDDDGPAPTGDVDSNGIRWDERIHSSGKSTTKTGAWTKRKNIDAALIQAVEAEQRGAPAGAAAAAAVMPVAPPVMPLAPTMPVPNAPVAMPSVPVAPVAPMPSVPAVPSDVPTDLMGLLTKVAALTGEGKVDADYLADLTNRIAVATNTPLKSLVDLGSNTELIAYTVQVMQHDQKW